MKITDLTLGANNIDDQIAFLKQRTGAHPDVKAIEKNIDIRQHNINDTSLRKYKVSYPNAKHDEKGNLTSKGQAQYDDVVRIALDIRNIVINRAVSFCFGNPVRLVYQAKDKLYKDFINALEQVLDDSDQNIMNRVAARSTFTYKECAKYWFTVDKKESFDDYGFPTKRKLKSVLFSPENGDTLYPIFDATNDLIAFSRSFSRRLSDSVSADFFETYTDEEIVRWKRSSIDALWQEEHREPVLIGKMPIVYYRQAKTENEIIDNIVDRLETAISNLGEINDHHTAPKIFVNGRLLSFGQKGQANTILQGTGEHADAKYLSWDHAPESFKLEVDFLLRMAYSLSQTPDISFESVKGIGAISGVALKLMFMDAHLKVKDKEEIFLPALRRDYKIIGAYLKQMNPEFKKVNMKIKGEIEPYMIADDLIQAQILSIANGGKAFMSQLESIKNWGNDNEAAGAELEQIQKEQREASISDVFEPSM